MTISPVVGRDDNTVFAILDDVAEGGCNAKRTRIVLELTILGEAGRVEAM